MPSREPDRGERHARGRSGTGATSRPERTRSTPVGRQRASSSAGSQPRGTQAGPLGLATTRRAAMVAVVVCALALSVAVPLRTYLAQRDEVHIQEQRKAQLRAQVEELERRKALLNDPAQLEAEARTRLRYVRPGETPYIVEFPHNRADEQTGGPARRPAPPQSWYEVLWEQASR